MVTDPRHAEAAAAMRKALAQARLRREAGRRHADGHAVELRALPDCDALFGVDFAPAPTPKASTP